MFRKLFIERNLEIESSVWLIFRSSKPTMSTLDCFRLALVALDVRFF